MKRTSVFKKVFFGSVGFVWILALTAVTSHADDVEIYTGQGASSVGSDPSSNLLFILDISGSMRGKKIADLKAAVADILKLSGSAGTIRNSRVGVATFGGNVARINYPLLPLDGPGVGGRKARDEIVTLVNGLAAGGGTPILAAYYEAVAYILGKKALFGSRSGYPGTQSNSATMDTNNPPNYNFDALSEDKCGRNVIVLLSDGDGNGRGYDILQVYDPDMMNVLDGPLKKSGFSNTGLGGGNASATGNAHANPNAFKNQNKKKGFQISDTKAADGKPCAIRIGQRCMPEMPNYAYERRDTDDADAPPVYTHTVGFGLSEGSTGANDLKVAAAAGRGTFSLAESKDDLIKSFTEIAQTQIETTSALSAPAMTVNRENRLYSSPDIFLNLFFTGQKSIWEGNVKKFRIRTCPLGDKSCKPGQYVGANGAVATNDVGELLEEGVGDIWDSSGDPSASNVFSGGLASKIADWKSRKIYTWTAPEYPDSVDASTSMSDRGWELYKIDRSKEIVGSASEEPELSDTEDTSESVGRLRKRLRQAHLICKNETDDGIDTDCMNNVVKYLLGAKTRDTQVDGPVANNRWPIAELLHNEVMPIPYGQTSGGETIIKLAFGTNDGGFHVHDASTGNEEFVIYPQEVLDVLPALESEDDGGRHIYGLDGGSSIRMRDANKDTIIDPAAGDFVHFYIGMRRGGYNYYAFNLTPDQKLTNHTQALGEPELLWVLRGTEDKSNPLHRLGQTWSKPQVARIQLKDGASTITKSVLIFGGGYDETVEDVVGNFGPKANTSSNLGNAIYIVDADSGEVLWWASSNFIANDAVSGLAVDDMKASIAADIKLVDSNNDRRIDRLYAADLMGQVWRVDLNADLSKNSVGRLANLGESGDVTDETDNADERKFFYEPDFARINDSEFSGQSQGADGSNYDVVALVSGNRASPLDATANDRLYVLRDYLNDELMTPFGSAAPTNYPACNSSSTAGCSKANSIQNAGLADVTNNVFSKADSATKDAAITALKRSNGFYFDLLNPVEVGFSKAQTLAGKLYFTTYGSDSDASSSDDRSQCSADLGKSRLYVVDVVTGNPVMNNGSNPVPTDRAFMTGSHPTSHAIPMITPTDGGGSILQGTTQTGTTLPPDPMATELSFYPTFWYQE